MKWTLVFMAAIAGRFLCTDAFVNYRCDQKLIKKIKKTWNGGNNDILDQLISLEKVAIYRTTPGFIVSAATCGAFTFKKEVGKIHSKAFLHMPLIQGMVRDKTLEVKEEGGAIICKDYLPQGKRAATPKDPRRMWYSVYNHGNVMAYYFCLGNNNKVPKGPPEGVLIVKQNDYSEHDVTKALEVLKSLGMDATVSFPNTC